MLAVIAVLTRWTRTQRSQTRTVFDESNLIGIRRGAFDEKNEFFQDAYSGVSLTGTKYLARPR